ncbi:hypothetical protein HZC08_02410 [Candidatus Micrarchaeota archaeon]|nr:hypothetical protein [Candidatus Micrarchaeota archaeon]
MKEKQLRGGQATPGSYSSSLTQITRGVLVDRVTYMPKVEKPEVIETGSSAHAIILNFRIPHGPARKLNIVATKEAKFGMSLNGIEVTLNGAEPIEIETDLPRIVSAKSIYAGNFLMRFLAGKYRDADCLVEVRVEVLPILVILTGVHEFLRSCGEAELRRSYIDLPAVKRGF